MRRMQLSLLILILQLAQIASAGDKARHSENDGLGRRQAKGSLQAEQVVIGSRSRARLHSRLMERDFEQEDRREEGDVVTSDTIGVRKVGNKNNKVRGFIRCRRWNNCVHHCRKINNQNKNKKGEL